ncbi:MAG: hypothetical protein R3B51_00395 [Thermodesulfobacteriota bacterium]
MSWTPLGKPLAKDPYIVKETGLTSYELIEGLDYQAGLDYWNRTAVLGGREEVWAEEIENQPLKLKNKYEDKKVYEYLFEYADNITSESAYNSDEGRKYAKSVIENFVITTGQPTETRRLLTSPRARFRRSAPETIDTGRVY